jgi:hypothetical protein
MPRARPSEAAASTRRHTSSRLEDPLGGRRVLFEFRRRTARANHELAPAVRADVAKHLVRARRAECALERADASLVRVRRKITIAALAPRPQLEHPALHSPCGPMIRVQPCRSRRVLTVRCRDRGERPGERPGGTGAERPRGTTHAERPRRGTTRATPPRAERPRLIQVSAERPRFAERPRLIHAERPRLIQVSAERPTRNDPG